MTASAKRVGRPRVVAHNRGATPLDDIIGAVGQLFGQGGYEAITMARVARRVGLRQPSLYYYFPNREELFAAFVARSYAAPLELVDQIVADGGSPASQIYRFAVADITLLCSLPFAVADIHRVAVRDRAVFAAYWADRDTLERRLMRILKSGIAAGEFRKVHVARTAQLLVLTDDAAQSWYRQAQNPPVGVIAAEIAEMTVRGLLVDASQANTIRCPSP